MRYVFLALIAGVVAGCNAEKAVDGPTAPTADRAPVVDMHTSRSSLDWQGVYEGVLACADCAGVHTQLTLDAEDGFQIVSRRLVRDADPSTERGRFEWQPDGNAIVLDAAGGGQRFAVGEGRLTLLAAGQSRPAVPAPDTVLAQFSPAWHGAGQDLAAMLQDHHWTLAAATDAANRRIDALFPDPQRSFEFSFAGTRLHVQGGCNGIRGAFQLGADDLLEVTGMMSTQMACEVPLMDADATLSRLVATPLELVVVRGAQPTLAMLTTGGDVLLLTGELTPEARYGTPTTVFLEIAAQAVACEESTRADGLCLQVRERSFDEQGLAVGTPAEWQAFSADIQGYRHEPGVRNVLRLKRFQPPADAGMPAVPVYVLDLVVESEVVRD